MFIIYNWSIKIKIMPNKKSINKEINEEEKEIGEAKIEEETSKSEKTKEKSFANNREKNKEEEFDKEDVEKNKYIAAFSYLYFFIIPLFIIPLLLKRDSIFCQKHAKQGLVWFAFLILTFFVYFIHFLNIFYGLMVLFVTSYSFIQTVAGKYWRIPVLYKWAEKINL